MAIIVSGRPVDCPSVTVKSWRDNPAWHLTAGEDRSPRRAVDGRKDVQIVVLHTTQGVVGPLKPGRGPFVDPATKTFKYWADAEKHSGAHFWVGPDGTVVQAADAREEQTPHASVGVVNNLSVGIEIFQSAGGVLYESQMYATVALVDCLTRIFNIARVYQWPYQGRPIAQIVAAKNFVGICGHRDTTVNRGKGDPGDQIYNYLHAAGYRAQNFATPDTATWVARAGGSSVLGASRPGDPIGMAGIALAAGAAFILLRRA